MIGEEEEEEEEEEGGGGGGRGKKEKKRVVRAEIQCTFDDLALSSFSPRKQTYRS